MDGLYKGRVVSIGSLDAAARIGVLTGDTFADGDDVVLAQGFELIRAPRSQLAIMAPGASTAGQLSLPSVALLRKLSVYTGIKDGQPKWFFPGNAIYCHAGVFDAHVHAKPKGTAGKGNPHTIASAKTAPEAAVLFDLAMTEVGFKKDLIFEHEPSLLHEIVAELGTSIDALKAKVKPKLDGIGIGKHVQGYNYFRPGEENIKEKIITATGNARHSVQGKDQPARRDHKKLPAARVDGRRPGAFGPNRWRRAKPGIPKPIQTTTAAPAPVQYVSFGPVQQQKANHINFGPEPAARHQQHLQQHQPPDQRIHAADGALQQLSRLQLCGADRQPQAGAVGGATAAAAGSNGAGAGPSGANSIQYQWQVGDARMSALPAGMGGAAAGPAAAAAAPGNPGSNPLRSVGNMLGRQAVRSSLLGPNQFRFIEHSSSKGRPTPGAVLTARVAGSKRAHPNSIMAGAAQEPAAAAAAAAGIDGDMPDAALEGQQAAAPQPSAPRWWQDYMSQQLSLLNEPSVAQDSAGADFALPPIKIGVGFEGMRVQLWAIRKDEPELAEFDVMLGSELGQGTFAVVSLGSLVYKSVAAAAARGSGGASYTDRSYAVKVLRQMSDYDVEVKVFLLLQGTAGVPVLRALGDLLLPIASTSRDSQGGIHRLNINRVLRLPCLVMDVLEPVEELVNRLQDGEHLSMWNIQVIAGAVLQLLSVMHSGRLVSDGQRYVVVHRDLSLRNLLHDGRNVYVSDYGGSALILLGNSAAADPAKVVMKTAFGTPGFMAPEIARLFEQPTAAGAAGAAAGGGQAAAANPAPQLYDSSVDMWSLGAVTMVLFAGGLRRMAKQLGYNEVKDLLKDMPRVVNKFVHGGALLGPMTAANKHTYESLMDFVDDCCGITVPRMTAAHMMGKDRPKWLLTVKNQLPTLDLKK